MALTILPNLHHALRLYRKSTYYRLETFLLEGSQGNDLMDYSKEQVITDILDQYERHLNFIHLHREAPGNSVMFPDV